MPVQMDKLLNGLKKKKKHAAGTCCATASVAQTISWRSQSFRDGDMPKLPKFSRPTRLGRTIIWKKRCMPKVNVCRVFFSLVAVAKWERGVLCAI